MVMEAGVRPVGGAGDEAVLDEVVMDVIDLVPVIGMERGGRFISPCGKMIVTPFGGYPMLTTNLARSLWKKTERP